MNIPDRPDAVAPEWLTDLLHEKHILTSASVASIEVEPLSDKGISGQLARLHLTYQGGEDDIPTTMIAKFSTTNPEIRDIYRAMRAYEKEVNFYGEIANTVALRKPKCFYNLFVPETAEHILLLEDLSPARAGSTFAGCSPAEMERIISEIAKFHATWWNRPELNDKQWLDSRNLIPIGIQYYQQAFQPFLDKVGDSLPAQMLTIAEKLKNAADNIAQALHRPPHTITHHDFHLDNLLFDVDGQIGTIAVLDWQSVQLARGTFDVGFFMSHSVETADRQAKEIDVLRLYHQLLVENGVKDYSFDEVLADYKRTLLYAFAQIAVAIGLGGFDNKLDVVCATILPRSVAAVLDLDCAALL